LDIASESGVKQETPLHVPSKIQSCVFLSGLACLPVRARALSYSFTDLLLQGSQPVGE
jgi:hypothetical protein